MATFRSPNEMLAKAKEMMLDGREPETKHDWMIIMNFFAANVDSSVAHSACRLIGKTYDMPITEQEIEQIVDFQLGKKVKGNG